jgi:hypothetical protein
MKRREFIAGTSVLLARSAGDTLWKSRGIYSAVELNRKLRYKRTPRRDRASLTARTDDR